MFCPTGIYPEVNISFAKGAPFVLVGTEVEMVCHSWPESPGPATWYRLTPRDRSIVKSGNVLNLHNVRVQDSGSYTCTYTTQDVSQPINLTVIGTSCFTGALLGRSAHGLPVAAAPP